MELELKNIKHSEFASQETNCYQGVVYLDGKPFAIVSNQGHGGCDYQDPDERWLKANERGTFQAEITKVNAHLASTKPIESGERADGSTWTIKYDLESWCSEQITKWLVTKDFKKIIKKVAMLDDGKLYTLNAVPTDANVAIMQKKYPKAQFLNAMPFDEGLSVYAQQCGVSF